MNDSDGEPAETITVSASHESRSINSSPRTVTILASDGGGATDAVNFESATYRVNEGSTVDVTVTVATAQSGNVTVPITMGGNATAIDDYTFADLTGNNNVLTITNGQTEASFTIEAVDDTDPEGDETILLGFGTITGGTEGSRTTSTVTINASDGGSGGGGGGGTGGGGTGGGGGGGGATPPTAATAPGAPTINAVTTGEGSLMVAWTAPEDDGGEAITAYDLRYIRSDATDKADDNWTVETGAWTGSGSLEYTVTGLTDDTEYDVQVRAVNAMDSGPWSATVTGTTAPPPVPTDPCVTALGTLTGTVTETGGWASGCESTNRSGSYAHFYTFTLEEGAEVTIDLTSSEDAYLFLLRGAGRDGAQVDSNDDATGDTRNSQIVETLATGSYTVEATTYSVGATGDFDLSVTGPAATTTPPSVMPTPPSGPARPQPTEDDCVLTFETLMAMGEAGLCAKFRKSKRTG